MMGPMDYFMLGVLAGVICTGLGIYANKHMKSVTEWERDNDYR